MRITLNTLNACGFLCSGAFPIRIRGGSVIGVAAVSGLPDPGDQTALLNGLRAYFEAHS